MENGGHPARQLGKARERKEKGNKAFPKPNPQKATLCSNIRGPIFIEG